MGLACICASPLQQLLNCVSYLTQYVALAHMPSVRCLRDCGIPSSRSAENSGEKTRCPCHLSAVFLKDPEATRDLRTGRRHSDRSDLRDIEHSWDGCPENASEKNAFGAVRASRSEQEQDTRDHEQPEGPINHQRGSDQSTPVKRHRGCERDDIQDGV